MLDLLINVVEALFIFLFVSVCTWKMCSVKYLKGDYKGIKILFTGLFTIILTNFSQFSFSLFADNMWGKLSSIIISSVIVSILFTTVFSEKRNYLYYLVASLGSMSILAASDILVITFSFLFNSGVPKEGNIFYILGFCALGLKYLVLILVIIFTQPKFFKNLINFEKAQIVSISYAASGVESIAKTQVAYFPSWFFFHQPKTPNCLKD